MRSDPKTSVALYSVSTDVDGAKIVRQTGVRAHKAIAGMLETSSQSLARDPQMVANILQGAMAGVSRKLLESASPEKQFEVFRQELIFFVCAYLEACLVRPQTQPSSHRRTTAFKIA